tara:strand:+ start:816 stop:1103 length:288 start_codon:yes stop_codon:yes gene_type:complete
MSEATITIKFTETELKLIIESLDLCIHELPQSEMDEDDDKKTPARLTLQKQLTEINTWIEDEKHKAITDKKASKGSFKEQNEMETSKRICVPCDD